MGLGLSQVVKTQAPCNFHLEICILWCSSLNRTESNHPLLKTIAVPGSGLKKSSKSTSVSSFAAVQALCGRR